MAGSVCRKSTPNNSPRPEGGSLELEQLDPADPSLDGHRLHDDRHCQLHCAGARHAAGMGDLLTAGAPLLPSVHRIVFIRAALHRQVARQEKGDASSMNKNPTQGATPSKKIDARIKELDDWRGKTLANLRKVIKQADPDVVEEWKWNVPVWSHDGIICTGETYKSAVKLTFAKGASLKDPAKLFNSSLEGNTRRAIDFREGDAIDAAALKALIRAAAAANKSAR